ncbi:hypothetical protein D3C71_1852980 [compost metagenome]
MDSGKRRSSGITRCVFKLSLVAQVVKGELSYKEAQFFEAVVNVLINGYGISVVKNDPASPLARANRRPEHPPGFPVTC